MQQKRFKDKNTDTLKFSSWLGIGGDKLWLIPRNPKHAAKLNKLLEQYPEGTKFTEHDEPVFKVTINKLDAVLAALSSSRIKQDLIA